MKAEKALKGKGFGADLVPVPREISSDCGVAIEILDQLKEEVVHLFCEQGVPPVDCYNRIEKGKYEKGVLNLVNERREGGP